MASPTAELKQSKSMFRFAPGDIVYHPQSGRRGVVVEVDRSFNGPDQQHRDLTRQRGPKTKPWYYVAFENTPDPVYIAECHLQTDTSGRPVQHPLINSVFTDFKDGRYIRLNH